MNAVAFLPRERLIEPMYSSSFHEVHGSFMLYASKFERAQEFKSC